MPSYRMIWMKIWLFSVLDVAGAPAQVERLVKPDDTVVIIGANGKSGILCNAVAKERAGIGGKVIGGA